MSSVRLFRKVLPVAHRAGTFEGLGRALTDPFSALDDLPVKLALVLMPFHASIIALHRRFAKLSCLVSGPAPEAEFGRCVIDQRQRGCRPQLERDQAPSFNCDLYGHRLARLAVGLCGASERVVLNDAPVPIDEPPTRQHWTVAVQKHEALAAICLRTDQRIILPPKAPLGRAQRRRLLLMDHHDGSIHQRRVVEIRDDAKHAPVIPADGS
jgi:hypothetical protein